MTKKEFKKAYSNFRKSCGNTEFHFNKKEFEEYETKTKLHIEELLEEIYENYIKDYDFMNIVIDSRIKRYKISKSK